jgi:hypothetical protein
LLDTHIQAVALYTASFLITFTLIARISRPNELIAEPLHATISCLAVLEVHFIKRATPAWSDLISERARSAAFEISAKTKSHCEREAHAIFLSNAPLLAPLGEDNAYLCWPWLVYSGRGSISQ